MLSLLMTTLNYRVDVLMLDGRVADAAIGIYSVGVQLAERVWMLPDAMKGVLVSNLTKGKGEEEVSYVIRTCNTICLLLMLAIIALGQPFINIFFGKAYSEAYQITLVMLAGVFAMIYYKMIGSYNIAWGRQKINLIFLGISVVTNVIMNLILIPVWGIYGAGLASVLSYTVCSALFIIYFCTKTKQPFKGMIFMDRNDFRRLKARLKRLN